MVSIPGTPSKISKSALLRARKWLLLASSAIALLAFLMVAGEDTDSEVLGLNPSPNRVVPPPDQLKGVDLSKSNDPINPPVPMIDERFIRSTGTVNEDSDRLDLSLRTDLPTVPDSLTAPDLSTVPDMPTVPDSLTALDLSIVPDMPTVPDSLTAPDLSTVPDMPTVPDSLTALDLSTVPDMPTVPDSFTAFDLSTVPDMSTVPLELVTFDDLLDKPLDMRLDLASIPGIPTVPATFPENAGIWAASATNNLDQNGQSINAALNLTGKTNIGAEPRLAAEWLQGIKQPLLRYATQQPLTLFDALMQALSYAPEIGVVRTELGIREQEIERQQGAFNWTQFIETTWDDLSQPVASNLDGVSQRLEQQSLNATGGVRKLNAAGGQASLSQDLGFRDSNSSFFNPNNQALSRIAMEYRQPLLRGAGRSVNLGQIQIAATDANISYEQMVGTIQRHLGQVAQAYWELVRLRGNYAIQLQNNQRIVHIAQILRNRQDLDIGPVRLARIEGAVTSSQADLLRAEYAVVAAQDQLLRLIYGSSFVQNANIETIPDIDLVGASSPLDYEYHIQLALQNRPEVLQSIQSIRRASVQHGIAKNQLLPLLGLTLSLSNRGTVGNRLLGRAISDQFSIGDPTYGIGLAYERPYRNQAAKANLQQTRLRLVQLQRQFEQTVADVVVDMRAALREVELSDQRRQLTEQTMQLTYRELVAQEQRMQLLLDGEQVGVLYLENLLQTQFRATSTSQQYLDATVGFFNAYFQLQRSNGTLIRRENPPVK